MKHPARVISFLIALSSVVALAQTPPAQTPPAATQTQQISAQDKPLLCDQQFALCTSARCIPEPGNPKVALCTCDVWNGKGMTGFVASCDAVKPSTDANGWRTVYSYFALTQSYQGKRLMKCPANTPWAECLNAKCTVDPADPSKAICACETKVQTGEWVTWGGNCNNAEAVRPF